jgi:hypothetical protein
MILLELSSHGLSGEYGLWLNVSSEGQAWYALRRTISSRVFAIGRPNQRRMNGVRRR